MGCFGVIFFYLEVIYIFYFVVINYVKEGGGCVLLRWMVLWCMFGKIVLVKEVDNDDIVSFYNISMKFFDIIW